LGHVVDPGLMPKLNRIYKRPLLSKISTPLKRPLVEAAAS